MKKITLSPPLTTSPLLPKELRPKPFPIVGIGASAGGIKAFITLLGHLDPDLGMAYVLVMHLSPHHKSALAEIVQAKTTMPVCTVKNGMEIKANNIFVIPPNTFMSVIDGHLKLAPRSISSIGNFGVDYFLTGLASIYKNNAIGIILSGTATDGTLGLKAIKAEGGITFAQDESAEFSGMPSSASDSGCVDFLLSPEKIAGELSRLVKSSYTILPPEKMEAQQVREIDTHSEEIKKILSIVKNKTGIDFFLQYKHASIYRRVVRRMALGKCLNLEEYRSMLKTNPKEVDALYDDFLINVTHFFRDPEFCHILTSIVFPSIIKQEKSHDPIRIWVAGCSTGEEAYSIAIILIEFLEPQARDVPFVIFASDLDANAIEKARLGIYPLSSLREVNPTHLVKYFNKLNGHYQIVKSVREMCVFSQHNLLKDPPFSRVDLISCQNVLIYLETNPQKKILQTFHYALKPEGHLFLGKSETTGTSDELFAQLDKKIKLYSRKPVSSPRLEFTVNKQDNPAFAVPLRTEHRGDIEKDMEKLMLSRFVHPSVVVDKSMKIVQFFGVTSPYLAPKVGKASLNVLKMIREDLVTELGRLLQQAKASEKPAIKENVRIYNKNILKEITIEVVPARTAGDIFLLVVFRENVGIALPEKNGRKSIKTADHKDETIRQLEEELVQSRAMIGTANEEYDTTYEELQANSEEILSSNEELQSVNEELEASKEELQSSIEDLTSTNAELHTRNMELIKSQEDLKKANEQLAEFAFISSHDLQEPLRKIETFSNLLTSHPEANLNDYARKYASKINGSASRMSTLLKDLLSFSILTSREHEKSAKVDLNETLKNVLEDFEVIIEEKNAVVTVSPLPVVYGTPVKINHVFHNLLSNALRFSKENPEITISSAELTDQDYLKYPALQKDTRYVAISVKDNGIGFDDKHASTVFMLFRRLNNSRAVEGTGVGLAICKKIVEDHHGLIFATAKENKGATFTVILPTDR